MVTVGDEIEVAYLEDGKQATLRGKVLKLGECITVLVESTARELYTKIQTYEKNNNPEPFLQKIRNARKANPSEKITDGPKLLRKLLNEVLRRFQLILVEVEPGISFWYKLFDCDPLTLQKNSTSGEFVYRDNPTKKQGVWNLEEVKFHSECTAYEEKIPGILTTLANWIAYGMASNGIRDFSIVADILESPYINRPDLIPYFQDQYKRDLENLVAYAAPLGKEVEVFRGSHGFADLHKNFTSSTILATSTLSSEAYEFVKTYKKVKRFIIPADYPVIDLRMFNPREKEILFIPPLVFHLVKQGLNDPKGINNINVYRLNLTNRAKGGTRKTQKRSKLASRTTR